MANRRMLNKTVVESDPFFEMPADSQALYMHLVLNADDEGFVGNPETIRRMTGFSKDSLKLLIAKGFLISFQSVVVVVTHWEIQNKIQPSRKTKTIFTDEKGLLLVDEQGKYLIFNNSSEPCQQDADKMSEECQRVADKTSEQVSIGKDKHICPKNVSDGAVFDERFEKFWSAYPKKVGKKAAQKAFIKIKPNEELLEKMLKAIETQKRSEQWQKENGQYIPNASTWLNGERWNDEAAETTDKNERFTNPEYYDNAEW